MGEMNEPSAARIEHILFDSENVALKAKDLELLHEGAFRLLVFCGPQSKNIPKDVAFAMQPLGLKADYVDVKMAGDNSLDFHLVYYLGRLSYAEPNSAFYVVSKDADYDPVIAHMKTTGISVQRVSSVGEVPPVKALKEARAKNLFADALTFVKERQPKTVKELHKAFAGRFHLGKNGRLTLIDLLREAGLVRISGEDVHYSFSRE